MHKAESPAVAVATGTQGGEVGARSQWVEMALDRFVSLLLARWEGCRAAIGLFLYFRLVTVTAGIQHSENTPSSHVNMKRASLPFMGDKRPC